MIAQLIRSSLLVLALFPVPLHAQGAGQRGAAPDAELLQRAAESRLVGMGDPRSAVTVLEFFDYSCSTCQAFHIQRGDSLKALVEEEGLALSLHTFIIPRLPRGYPAAEAALCAGAVGGAEAWEAMHDRIMRNVFAWRTEGAGPEPFARWAGEAGLDEEAYADCLHRDLPAPLVFTDGRLATRFGVSGTPTFVFIPPGATESADIVSFYGNVPMSTFREALDRVRARAR